ncbi:hypothetical protein ScPMuIL_016106 [Solemya velum]
MESSLQLNATPDVPKATRLSLHLLVKRHLPPEAESWDQEKILQSLSRISHLRLDRENIRDIDSLELLGDSVTNVYLQQNIIERIENFECLKNLQFLTLAGNRIRKVENLSNSKLLFLDLSNNKIEEFDIDEFPQSLIILNLKYNPCTKGGDYRGRIIQDLPCLRQLDEEEITREEKLEAGFAVSSESSEEEELYGSPEDALTKSADSIQMMACQVLQRSQDRIESDMVEHKKRASELEDLRVNHDKVQIPSTKLPH